MLFPSIKLQGIHIDIPDVSSWAPLFTTLIKNNGLITKASKGIALHHAPN